MPESIVSGQWSDTTSQEPAGMKWPAKPAKAETARGTVSIANNENINPNTRDNGGRTPLMLAAASADSEKVKALIKAGANVEARDYNGQTPLSYAGSAEVVQLLLNAGAYLEAHSNFGRTPLMKAMSWNIPDEVAEALIAAGADVNVQGDDGQTPLMWAAGCKSLNVIKTLLLAGADITALSCNGETVLDYARRRDDNANGEKNEILDFLTCFKSREFCKIGGSKARDTTNFTDLFEAAIEGDATDVRLLVKSGVDVNIHSKYGETPLMLAHSEEIVLALLDMGARLEARNRGGRTPLLFAAAHTNSLEVIRALLNAGARLEARNDDGQTPLMEAAHWNRQPEIVEALLDAGADVTARDNLGWTVMRHAKHNFSSAKHDIIKILKEHGVKDGGLFGWL